MKLLDCHTLVALGQLDPGKLEDALLAIKRSSLCSNQALSLLVASDHPSRDLVAPQDGCVRRYPRTTLGIIVDNYQASGQLLFPCANEDYGNAFLYALISGVPLNAINFKSAPGRELASGLPRNGEAFLGIGRPAQ